MTIYVYLVGEGTDCWRPVKAVQLENNWFRIASTAPEGEEWEFLCGDVVRCEVREFSSGSSALVAVEKRKTVDGKGII